MTKSRGYRRRLSRAEQEQVWTQWRAGASLEAIRAGLAVSSGALSGAIARRGGIAPRSRQRAARTLSEAERRVIERGLATGQSARAIARHLGRAPSTVSREIARNGQRTATTRHYAATVADGRAWARAGRPKPCRLATHARLRAVVAARLAEDWSPAQIAGWLVTTYPDDPTLRVSAETIYRSLYVQARGVLRQELTAHLRRGRPQRRSRARGALAHRTAAIVDGVSIRARPPEVEDRAIPGHWEGDLLLGGRHSQIVTLVERASRFVVLIKVPSKESVRVVDALIHGALQIPAGLRRSLTWDRGSELAHHQRFRVATDVAVYFCDPRSPWQRGSNENTNGLLRQYFPKGVDLTPYSQADLDRVAERLNTRPRQTLGFRTPADIFAAYLASSVASTG